MGKIILKTIKPDEIEILYHWFRNEKQLHHFTCQPVATFDESLEEYVEKKTNLYASGKSYEMLICRNADKSIIGKLSCFNINRRNRSAEIGYYLPPGQRGKGYGYDALRQFVALLFETRDFNKVYATTSSGNRASIRILEKSGFSLDGRNREHYWIDENRFDQLVYSLLRREWAS